MNFRIGQGYDVHRLVPNRKLILCGAEIPHETGLLGHSDADVATHALCDAILGAIGEGDIGRHFPDSAEEYRGISSIALLTRVCELMKKKGYCLGNADLTVIAERPKIAGYISQMKENLAFAIGCDITAINIKGTTEEKLGFTGREEGIAALATVLVYHE